MKLIALDVGEKRIGVAKADSSVKIAVPVGMIAVNGQEIKAIARLCRIQDVDVIVVGMPRNLQGVQTAQSNYVKDFVKVLNKELTDNKPNGKTIRIFFQDESLTSVEAEEHLKESNKPINKKTGEIDAEAATIILQDFLENLARRIVKQDSPAGPQGFIARPETVSQDEPDEEIEKPAFDDKPDGVQKAKSPKKKIVFLLSIVGVIVAGLAGAIIWYNSSLSAIVSEEDCLKDITSDRPSTCSVIKLAVEEGTSVSEIADMLEKAKLIKSSLAFKIYAKISGESDNLKAGKYSLEPSMSVKTIYKKLLEGTSEADVFRFTVLPGETLSVVKKRLMEAGYLSQEIDKAFGAHYDHPVLADKPEDASLEGYLFGETYEFYQADSVETIITRMLDELYSVVEQNNLKEKFSSLGLSLHEGIILASVVQKEAGTVSEEDQKTVARVFLNRLDLGMPLGSDVTASYAVDQVDPNRVNYSDNASVLAIDSCYNTRLYGGLPCGAISSPGATVLISTANPAESSYLYFLTGDDGLMYYSNTEAEHLQNVTLHCQTLCNVQL